MGNVCKLVPTINTNGEEKESILFKSLSPMFEYGIAQSLWAYTKTQDFKNNLEKNKITPEYDENGEVTLATLNRVVNLTDISKSSNTTKGVQKIVGATNSKGDTVEYTDIEEVTTKITDFNANNPKWLARIHINATGNYNILVERRTDSNKDDVKQEIFNSSLNKKLRNIMRNLGFDVSVSSGMRYAGMFNPLSAMDTADKFKKVIYIKEGKLGEEAFPEEFAHWAIAGLANDEVIKRALHSLENMEVVKTVLGDKYNSYSVLYKGDEEQLRLEALGHMLAAHIKGEAKDAHTLQHTSLLDRVVNFVFSLFGTTTESAINIAIENAHREIDKIATTIIGDELDSFFNRFNPNSVFESNIMYAVDKDIKELDKMEAAADKLLVFIARKRKYEQYKGSQGIDIKNFNIKNIDEELMAARDAADENERAIHFRRGFTLFLKSAAQDLMRIKGSDYSELQVNKESDWALIKDKAAWLNAVKSYTDAYADVISSIQELPVLIKNGVIKNVNLQDFGYDQLSPIIGDIKNAIDELTIAYNTTRKDFILTVLKVFWGKDKFKKVGNKKEETITLEMMLDTLDKDITFADRWINSMSDASDPILSIVDKGVKKAQTRRDLRLKEMAARIDALSEKFNGSTDFVYERDENGNLTGNYRSNYDFKKYHKEYVAEKERIKKAIEDGTYEEDTYRYHLNKWKKTHRYTDQQYWIHPTQKAFEDSFGSNEKWEYYKAIMDIKVEMDSYLNLPSGTEFRAPQIRNDVTEALLCQGKGLIGSTKVALSKLGDAFVLREDDTEFGDRALLDDEEFAERQEYVTEETNLSGETLKKVPKYYINRLESMDRLSTDCSMAMKAYCAMAINFDEMSSISDVLDMTGDVLGERKVNKHSGDKPVFEVLRFLGQVFKQQQTVKGGKAKEKFDSYVDRVVYGNTKDKGAIKHLFTYTDKNNKRVEVNINTAKLADAVKSYAGIVSLGFNVFSAISNVTVGKLQMLIDANASRMMGRMGTHNGEPPIGYFDLKDLSLATGKFYSEIMDYTSEVGSINKSSKLGLIMDLFDANESFFEDVKRDRAYGGVFSRLVGNTSVLVLQNIGEFNLHAMPLLSMLNRIKVKVNGKKTLLYDALKVVTEDSNGNKIHRLILPQGTTNMEGKLISTEGIDKTSPLQKEIFRQTHAVYSDFISEIKTQVGKVSQSFNGAFNETDKGEIHKAALGRLAMQFRQWMPAHYSRRFASSYYDAILDKEREGYYRTFLKFSYSLTKGITQLRTTIPLEWGNLTAEQQMNVCRALSELEAFVALSILIAIMGPVKDKDNDYWAMKMAKYQLMRVHLETGASIPWKTIVPNIMTIMQSPAAAITHCNNLLNLLNFSDLLEEVDSGPYEGWSKYKRNAINSVPLGGNFMKAWHFTDDSYMFKIFNQQ